MEDYFLGKATERIFLPLLRMIVPDIIDYSLPISGRVPQLRVREDQKRNTRTRPVASCTRSGVAGQMGFTKFIVVVDEHVDVHDEQDVLFHLFSNCDPQRDSEIVHGPVDILDHASPAPRRRLKDRFRTRRRSCPKKARFEPYPKELEFDQATKDLIWRRWKEYGL